MGAFEKLKTRFTALGLSGSGKTCYVMGMYSEMACGIRGWTITTANSDADRIVRQLSSMNDTSQGADRFPPGTQDYVFDDYEFKLFFKNGKIMNFNWADYAGAILTEDNTNYESRELLDASILTSSTLYIFIDGECLIGDSIKEKSKKVKKHCSDYINPRIQEFMNSHGGYIPPIVFVITKSDLCMEYTSLYEIKTILEERFSSIMYNENVLIYITLISLGNDISENDYTGELEPINIQTPFFIGIAHDFAKACAGIKYEIDQDIAIINKDIERREDEIRKEENSISENRSEISKNEREIRDNEAEIRNLRSQISNYNSEISSLKDRESSLESSISDEQRYINNNSGGFLWLKSLFNHSEIKAAEARISDYRSRINSVNSQISSTKGKISSNELSISVNELSISDKKLSNSMMELEIGASEASIDNNKDKIEIAKENIRKNKIEIQKYRELLKDVLEELKKQHDDKQFIVISGGKSGSSEAEFDIQNLMPENF